MKNATVNKSELGFTLLDLTISVAILSVLATLAMTNYHQFVAKARQGEAKQNLASLFAAEKSFHSEWGAYTGDFRDLGLEISGARLRYNFGFSGAGAPVGGNFVASASGGCGAGTATNTGSPCALSSASSVGAVAFGAAPAAGGCGGGEDPSASSFRASAIGSIGGATPDIWSMDEQHHLCNNQQGSVSGSIDSSAGAGAPAASAATAGGGAMPTPAP